MNFFKSHFSYNRRQRNGIFFLLGIIIVLQTIFFYVDFSSDIETGLAEKEVLIFQKEVDSLRLIQVENSKPKIFPYNPNYISDFKGFQLGMSVEEIDKLLRFREKGNYVNSAKEFQEVTGVGDSLLNVMSHNFKFPDWVTSKKSTSNKKPSIQKNNVVKDINTATIEELKAVNGIGEKLGTRILNYREKLQGFSFNDQLYEVWYLDKEVADKVLLDFQVIEQPLIQKININEASFKEVLSIVYLDYELTKKIFEYKDEVAEIQSIEELKKIDGFPIEKFSRIALYLLAE